MKPHPQTTPSGLIRVMGPLMGIAVVVGTVIGSGIFKKPQAVADAVPFFGLAATVWVIGGLMALLGALALAEVSVLYPRAGGNYVFLREGYGRLAGFLWGWVEFWIIRCASIAALATIFTDSLYSVLRELAPGAGEFLGYWPQRLLTAGVILGLALVNARGVRWGGGLQVVITTVKVASLLGIILLPFAVVALMQLAPAHAANTRVIQPENLTPAWPGADQLSFAMFGKFITALLGVLWAYHGWMNIAPVAEEIRDPQRNIPRSLLGGVAIIIGLYLGCNLSYCLVLSQDELREMKDRQVVSADGQVVSANVDRTVAIGFCRRLIGPIGVAVAAAAVMCSVFGALNGNLLVGPRLLYAMGEDGLAPRALSAVHPAYNTPALAILVMAAWSALLVLGTAAFTQLGLLSAAKDHFDVLTDFAMFGAVIFETMAVASIFVFRRTRPDAERPYRCPGYPWVPALYVLFPMLVLGNMFVNQRTEALVGVGFIAVGAAVYGLFLRRAVRDEAANVG
jgi:basic amino acid/polyamine antiporter, APA family